MSLLPIRQTHYLSVLGKGAAQRRQEGTVLSLRELWDLGQTPSFLSIQPVGGTRVKCSPTLKLSSQLPKFDCHLKIRSNHRNTLQIPSFFGKK